MSVGRCDRPAFLHWIVIVRKSIGAPMKVAKVQMPVMTFTKQLELSNGPGRPSTFGHSRPFPADVITILEDALGALCNFFCSLQIAAPLLLKGRFFNFITSSQVGETRQPGAGQTDPCVPRLSVLDQGLKLLGARLLLQVIALQHVDTLDRVSHGLHLGRQ